MRPKSLVTKKRAFSGGGGGGKTHPKKKFECPGPPPLRCTGPVPQGEKEKNWGGKGKQKTQRGAGTQNLLESKGVPQRGGQQKFQGPGGLTKLGQKRGGSGDTAWNGGGRGATIKGVGGGKEHGGVSPPVKGVLGV